jgi:hypothetical protein
MQNKVTQPRLNTEATYSSYERVENTGQKDTTADVRYRLVQRLIRVVIVIIVNVGHTGVVFFGKHPKTNSKPISSELQQLMKQTLDLLHCTRESDEFRQEL